MRYKELSAKMVTAGWLSHIIAACNTDHRPGSGQKHFTVKRLSDTRTGQAYHRSQAVPIFDSTSAVPANIRFHDEHGWREERVSIDRAAGLVSQVQPGSSRRLVAFLSDIPSNRITYDSISAPPTLPSVPSLSLSDIETDGLVAHEGTLSIRQHLYRERDPKIIDAKRRQVLAKTGRLACSVCTFDFERFYVDVGAEFCEVHHLRPLGDAEGEVETSLNDLAIVCSNCHRMLHRSRPFLTLEQLKSKIRHGPTPPP